MLFRIDNWNEAQTRHSRLLKQIYENIHKKTYTGTYTLLWTTVGSSRQEYLQASKISWEYLFKWKREFNLQDNFPEFCHMKTILP